MVNQIGGKERYFFGNLLWQTRGTMDLLVGHRLAKGRPARPYLEVGDAVDSWKVIIVEPEKQLALLFGMKAPGLGRLCFTLKDKGDRRELDVRARWHPHGMPGLFYWLFMIPAHLFIFREWRNELRNWQNKNENNSLKRFFFHLSHCIAP